MPDAAVAGCGQTLPDDVVREILARISDVTTLFRCAVVCKSWCRLVADPATLAGRRWPDAEGSSFPGPLLGFFVQRHRLIVNAQRKVSRLFPTRAPAFVPALGSALGPGRRFLTSFVRDDAGLLDEAKPATARGGLLLARVSPPRAAATGHFALHLCVCNLLTGRTDFLPPLDAACFDGEGVRGYALLTAADHGAGPHPVADGYSTFFQVILIGIHHDDRKMYVYRFSSSSAAAAGSSSSAATAAARPWSWRKPICCHLLIPDNLGGPRGCRIAAVSGGTARWLFHRALSLYTLDVSATTGCVTATRLPLDALPYVVRWDRTNVWLFQSRDDKLSLLYLENNQLYIWTQQAPDQDGAMAWYLTQAVQLAAELGLLGTESLSAVCIGEKSGAMLALHYSDPEHACMIDLSTGSMAGLQGWRRSFNYMTAVPCDDINWPVFFMSRLGGRMM